MWFLLAFLPWVLTTVALLIILVRKIKKFDEDFFGEDEEFSLENIKETIKVAVYEDKAYWVYENVFYESEVTREPDFSTAKAIDTMSLSDKELKELMEVLDELEKHNERD